MVVRLVKVSYDLKINHVLYILHIKNNKYTKRKNVVVERTSIQLFTAVKAGFHEKCPVLTRAVLQPP